MLKREGPSGAPQATVHDTRPRLRYLVAALLVALPVAAAAAYALRQPVTHLAEAEVVYQANAVSSAQAAAVMSTQVSLVSSTAVLGPVADTLDVPIERIRQEVSAEAVGGSSLIRISAEDRDTETAVELASAVAESYVQVVDQSAAPSQEGDEFIEGQIAALDESFTEVQDQIAELGEDDTVGRTRLESRATAILSQQQALQSQQAAARLQAIREAPSATVVTPAYLSDASPISRWAMAAAGGLMIGILLATTYLLLVNSRAGKHRTTPRPPFAPMSHDDPAY